LGALGRGDRTYDNRARSGHRADGRDRAADRSAAVAEIEDVDQNFDPEKTLVREDWESTAIRRVAPHVAAVQEEVAADDDEPFGWESEAVRRLSRVVQNNQL